MFVRWSAIAVLLSSLLFTLGCGSGEVAPRDDLPSDEIPENIQQQMDPDFMMKKMQELREQNQQNQ
jgi:hypothetical protein